MGAKHDPSLGDARGLRNIDAHDSVATLSAVKAFLASPEANDILSVKEVHDRVNALTDFLERNKGEEDEILDHSEATIRLQRRMGELLPGITGGKGGRRGNQHVASRSLRLAKLGISKGQSSRWQKLATVEGAIFEGYIRRVREQGGGLRYTRAGVIAEATDAKSHKAGYDSDEWYTPPTYIEAAREVLGGIDLDPASNPTAQKTVKAAEYFTKDDDGLTQKWNGRVFCNPPYSNQLAKAFAKKLIDELDAGRVISAILLQNANTDTGWFHDLTSRATAICLTKGRIPFVQADGEPGANRYGSVFFYFGDDLRLFDQVFSLHGLVLRQVAV